MNNQILSDPELRRFKDQISLPFIGFEGQQRLKNLRIAVIGAGGIGTALLQLLSSIGIGQLGIIDYRLVEENSMQRQTLFGGNDLGKLKTILSRERLQSIFPFVNYEIINLEITAENAKRIFSKFDFIIDSSNLPATSSITFEACKNLELPSFYGSVSDVSGMVTIIDFKKAPKTIVFNEIFSNTFNANPSGKISIAYNFVAVLICNEILNFNTPNPSFKFSKRIRFDLSDYRISIE